MRSLVSLAVALSVALGACVGLAAEEKKPKKTAEEQFKAMDKNSDGKLNLEEFIGKRTDDKKANAEKQFKRKDKNNDGSLDLEEFKAGGGKKKEDKKQ
jgi:Ca2+-binding EF-hand superfamily protein